MAKERKDSFVPNDEKKGTHHCRPDPATEQAGHIEGPDNGHLEDGEIHTLAVQCVFNKKDDLPGHYSITIKVAPVV